MRLTLFSFMTFLALTFSTVHADDETPIDVNLVSRAIGHMMARQLKTPGFEFNIAQIIEGMHEASAGKEAPLTDDEVHNMLDQIQAKVFLAVADENLEKANAFLKENGEKKEVISKSKKLQYTVHEIGKGKSVAENDTPLIHYTGKLIDGTVFATSRDQDDPIPLPLAQTIEGFSQGITGMKEGEKRTFYIHPELAYGVNGQLPPNSLLIFDVEIVQANVAEEAIASAED